MATLIFGLLLIAGGVGLYVYGTNLNNDLGQQIQSILTTGTKNPGSSYITIGVVIGVIGLILLIAGVIILAKKSENPEEEVTVHPFEAPNEQFSGSFFCPFCGAENDLGDSQCRCCKKDISRFQK